MGGSYPNVNLPPRPYGFYFLEDECAFRVLQTREVIIGQENGSSHNQQGALAARACLLIVIDDGATTRHWRAKWPLLNQKIPLTLTACIAFNDDG